MTGTGTGAAHAARAVGAAWWPLERLAEGMEELARRAGLAPRAGDNLGVPPQASGELADIGRWMEWAAARMGLEAEAVEATVPAFGDMLAGAGPAVLACDDARGVGFLLLLRARGTRLTLIGPDLRPLRVAVESVRQVVCGYLEAPLIPEIDRVIESAGVAPARRRAVRDAMLRERLARQRAGVCRMLRLPPGAPLLRQWRQAGLRSRVAGVMGMFALLYGIEFAAWGLIGNAALGGRLDHGWLLAWLLLMVSVVPLHMAGAWLESTFALDAGRIMKTRLLEGALRLDLDAVRRQGVGHLLGRVLESQAFEGLALSGGMGVAVALLELLFALWILWLGAGGAAHVALALLWLGLMAWSCRHYHGRLRAWTLARIAMTHDLTERMVGHRTRLAQEQPQRRDRDEDRAMKTYLDLSRQLDRAGIPFGVLLPGGWITAALAALAPAFVAGSATPAALAISLGGIMVAQRAFAGIAGGVNGLSRAWIAYGQVAEMFHAARAGDDAPFVTLAQMGARPGPPAAGSVVDASGVRFAYQDGERVLKHVDLRLARGDRVLLEGPSGGGKSTLAALLTGLRAPSSGLLLLNGLDHHTLGENWLRMVTAAPQFHENHVLSGTVEFNLLMGREWPAPEADLREAEALCEELGLKPLLQRMPAGLMQQIGETGWQLSHGERSRLFLARALLQKTQVTILDESFAALDPETLALCLRCAMRRADTLVVIAHP